MLLKIIIISFVIYFALCVFVYLIQERLIFFPEKLTKDYSFQFEQTIEEIYIKTQDQKLLNGVLFHTDSSRGLIFYLHGNAGSIRTWGEVAKTYTDLNYDVFMLDYRGYGKSEGSIRSQNQLYHDLQMAYDEIKKRYSEDKIIILGFSIGTGIATNLASANNPKLLILEAPFYSLTDLMKRFYPILPTFILKYKFETNNYIKNCKMPIVLIHGTQDEIIYYQSSIKLKELVKNTDTLIILNGQRHNGMADNLEYREHIKRILGS